jgi:hypothetical protein
MTCGSRLRLQSILTAVQAAERHHEACGGNKHRFIQERQGGRSDPPGEKVRIERIGTDGDMEALR